MNRELKLQMLILELIKTGKLTQTESVWFCDWLEERHLLLSYDPQFCKEYCNSGTNQALPG